MNGPTQGDAERDDGGRAAAAARWVMRQDRGLSPAEQDEYLQWLTADPRHAEAMARQRGTWDAFDRIAGLETALPAAPDPDLLAPRAGWRRTWPGRLVRVALPVAVAAGVFSLWWRPATPGPAAAPQAAVAGSVPRLAPIEERTLADGSVVRLNRGAEVTVEFLPGERRVRLEQGEAAFAVAKDPGRPFVVVAAGVAVRAVGTAFNVRLAERSVEVILTEGRVAVAGGTAGVGALPELRVGQRAWVPLDAAAGAPTISQLTADELARRLAWQPRLLSFNDEALTVMLAEFNRHNPVVLRAGDATVGGLRLTARFRSDNVEGFLRLLASDFGVRATLGEHGQIVLRAADRTSPRSP
jgi:transmembrane sensor